MPTNNKVPFGLKDGRLVEVSEVSSGLACGCVCPACHRRLQANKGQNVTHYFSHDPSEDAEGCASAYETSLHLMAKQLLSEDGGLVFPGQTLSVKAKDDNLCVHIETAVVEESGVRYFERVEMEKWLEEIRPDIVGYINNAPFLIEIAVTSFVGDDKKNKIRALGLAAIEIDLSDEQHRQILSKDALREAINGAYASKKWISNPRAIAVKKALTATLKEKIKRINENIRRQPPPRKKNPYKVRSTSLISSPVDTPEVKQKTTFDPRWFYCRACRNYFSLALRDIPPSANTVPCPSCGAVVSTAEKPFR